MRSAALALLALGLLFVALRLANPSRSADPVASEGSSAQLSPVERDTSFDGVRY